MCIPEMPVFRPTEEEFKNPIDYIEKIFHEHQLAKAGTIKIIPPKSFKPSLCFDTNSNNKLPTRYQVLQKLSQSVPFDQNFTGHRFKDFRALSLEREKEDDDVDWNDDQDIFKKIEKQYWDLVENQIGEETKVEYAADLVASRYGSGFGRRD